MNRLLENKVAVVTGSSQGLGRAIAGALGVDGARVVLASRSEERVRPARQSLESAGISVSSWVGDLTAAASAEHLMDHAVSVFGGVDILVNCAGSFIWKPFLEMTGDEWQRVVDTNLSAAFHTTQSAARLLIDQERGGVIVNIASIHGSIADPNVVAQCASKAGLIGLTKATAEALRPYDIRVNAVSPGSIDPDSANRRGESPRKRVTQADIAGLVTYLVSDLSRSLTGVIIDAFGGTRTVIKV